MSSISNVGASDPTSMLSSIAKSASVSTTQDAQSSTSTSRAERRAQFEAKFKQAATDLGFNADQLASVGGQIRDAVKQAKASGGNDKAAIQDAVNKVLEANNIDPAQYKSEMGQIMQKMGVSHHGHHHGSGASGPTASAVSGSGVDADGDHDHSQAVSFLASAPAGTFVDANA